MYRNKDVGSIALSVVCKVIYTARREHLQYQDFFPGSSDIYQADTANLRDVEYNSNDVKGDHIMKRIFSFFLTLLMFSLLAVPASATNVNVAKDISRSTTPEEIAKEAIAAEEFLNEPCNFVAESIQEEGDYIVVERLYVSEKARAKAGNRGAVVVDTWYKEGSSSWSYKVQFGAWFDYDGKTAEVSNSEAKAFNPSYKNVSHIFDPLYINGNSAIAELDYKITAENKPLEGVLLITCDKNGSLSYPNNGSQDRWF